MKNLKDLLKTGVFGRTNEGENFGIVDDRMIYQDGGFDWIRNLNSNLEFPSFTKIDFLVKGIQSFNHLNSVLNGGGDGRPEIIYQRNRKEPTTFKVVCVEQLKFETSFTVGKIYTWDEGKLIDDDGYVFTSVVKGTDPDKWGLSKYYKFIVIKE